MSESEFDFELFSPRRMPAAAFVRSASSPPSSFSTSPLPSSPLSQPTLPQALTVPAALEGRDIVARARTGSGKTLAFLLPAFHAVARLSAAGDPRAAAAPWRALALVPTRELAEQVADVADALAAASGIHLRTSTLAAAPGGAATTGNASSNPSSLSRECQPARCGQLVVSTPGRLASALRDARLTPRMLSNLSLLAVDEADLLLSLPGYSADVAAAAAALPRSAQRILLSATSAAAVDELGELMLQSPVRIDATGFVEGDGGNGGKGEGEEEGSGNAPSSSSLQPPLAGVASSVSHFFLEASDASEAGKLATLIALLKLGAAKRRVLVFVADDDEGIKLKLALAAFGVRAARLGAALPLNSRHHALQEFNRGVYDYLIATDDGRGDSLCAVSKKKEEEEEEEEAEEEEEVEEEEAEGKKRRRKKPESKKKRKSDAESLEEEDFGVVRGIDFSGVRTVVNYSVPRSSTSYVHRAGRTGRAGARGAVVTLFSRAKGSSKIGESEEKQRLEASLVASSTSSSSPSPSSFRLLAYPRLPPTAAAALRYRVDDVARALTKPALREARAQELRRELLNSSRLAAHFSAAPKDLALLRHDAPLSAAGRAAAAGGGGLLGSGGTTNGGGSSHLKRLPSYLMAAAGLRGKAAAAAVAAAANAGGAKKAKSSNGSGTKRTRDDGDPLRSLAAAEKKKPAAAEKKSEKPAPVFFDSAPKRGGNGGGGEKLTPVEKKAQVEGEKAAKKLAKKQAPLLAKVAAAAQLKTAIAKKHRRR